MSNIYGITLRNEGKIYYFNGEELEVENGKYVVVETEKGIQLGKVAHKAVSEKVNIPIENMKKEDWESSVNTNLNGAFYVLNNFTENVKRAKGDIVVVGSHSEKYTFEEGSAYCSTKLALRGMAECLREELRYDDIRVMYLSLGSIKNRDHNIDEEWKLMPEEIGEAIESLIELPKKVYMPYIDMRPLKPLKDEKKGIEKLQYV